MGRAEPSQHGAFLGTAGDLAFHQDAPFQGFALLRDPSSCQKSSFLLSCVLIPLGLRPGFLYWRKLRLGQGSCVWWGQRRPWELRLSGGRVGRGSSASASPCSHHQRHIWGAPGDAGGDCGPRGPEVHRCRLSDVPHQRAHAQPPPRTVSSL